MPGLLAEVYIRMTRGQDSLVIESTGMAGGAHAVEQIDFSALDLIVIEADETECVAHAALLAEIDKASAGRTLWRGLGA
jgi:DNA polymerase-3 subunit epsilon